jgi:hypothetical protein
MDVQKALLVIGITLFVVILFNIGIYLRVKGRRVQSGEIDLLKKAFKKARDPWGDEKSNLEALSKKVAELQQTTHKSENSNDQ